MALNEKFRDADHLSLPVAAGKVSGDPVLVGAIPGVLQTNIGEGGNPAGYATVWTKGAFDLPVTGAVATVGAPIYINASGTLDLVNTGTLFGYALATQTATGTIPVKIAQA